MILSKRRSLVPDLKARPPKPEICWHFEFAVRSANGGGGAAARTDAGAMRVDKASESSQPVAGPPRPRPAPDQPVAGPSRPRPTLPEPSSSMARMSAVAAGQAQPYAPLGGSLRHVRGPLREAIRRAGAASKELGLTIEHALVVLDSIIDLVDAAGYELAVLDKSSGRNKLLSQVARVNVIGYLDDLRKSGDVVLNRWVSGTHRGSSTV